MAAAAEAAADRIVVTDDNPRTEDPDRIVAMIVAAFSGRVPVHVERDRETAIRGACSAARRGDVILVAGKGHEDYQIYGHERRAFSDRAIAESLQREAA
jgi:UDP-N-acetylmuramoyl-L-alanyl-D-glutamate--2,6-diaminopimelate ligase